MNDEPHLEPLAEKILAEIRVAVAAGKVDGHPPDTQVHILSAAVSLKRIADRLEQFDLTPLGNQLLDIAYQAGVNFRGHA